MLGASAAAFFLPFSVGYALHAGRGPQRSGLGRVALALALFEALACLILAGLRLWSMIARG